jgi:hypothetical protein
MRFLVERRAPAAADPDLSGDADGSDFLIWQRQLGPSGAAANALAVPEPAGPTLAAFASLFGVVRCRHRKTAAQIGLSRRASREHRANGLGESSRWNAV